MSLEPGTNAVFRFQDSSNAWVTMVGHGFELGFTLESSADDSTRFGDTYSSEDTILKSASGSLSVNWDDTIVTKLLGVYGNQTGIEYSPVGTATGKTKLTGNMRVASVELPSSVTSKMTVTSSLGPAGVITIGTN